MNWDKVGQYALMVFTIEQWTALGIVLVVVLSVTEQVKRIWFVAWSQRKKRRAVQATASGVSILAALVGYFANVPGVAPWFWLFVAVTGGYVSGKVQQVIIWAIGKRSPALAERLEGKAK